MRTRSERGKPDFQARQSDRERALANQGKLVSRLRMPSRTESGHAHQNSSIASIDSAEVLELAARLPSKPPLNVIERIAFGAHRREAPSLLKLLVSIAVGGGETAPTCIVLPTARGVGTAVAILAALEFLSADLDDARRSYLATLKPGTRVRLLPNREIFEIGDVDGLGVRLRLVDVKNYRTRGSKIVPLDKIFSLEPTDRTYPYGAPNTSVVTPPETDTDLILGQPFYGNSGLVRTRVLLVGARSEFEAGLAGFAAVPALQETRTPLAAAFPFGGVDENGNPFVVKPPGSAGQPLVAVANRISELSGPCLRHGSEPNTLVVLSDRVDAVLNELGLAGRMAERQRLVLFADGRRRADLEPLRRQGWTIWEPLPSELEPASGAPVQVGCAGIDKSVLASVREQAGGVDYMTCASAQLTSAEKAMVALGELLAHESVADEDWVHQLREDAQQIFFSVVGWLASPPPKVIDEIGGKAQALLSFCARLEKRFGPGSAGPLRTFVESASGFHARVSADGITPKGQAILNAASSSENGVVLVAGTAYAREEASQFLADRGMARRVLSLGDLDGDATHVIGFGLLRRIAFERLFDPWPALRIQLLGYDFETAIYKSRMRRRDMLRSAASPGNAKKSVIAGFRIPEPNAAIGPDNADADKDLQHLETVERVITEWKWQRRVVIPRAAHGEPVDDVRIVRFVGRSWCPMTDDHRLVVLRGGGTGTRTGTGTVDALEPGTRIIVREGGDKDVIRLLAEERVGAARYAELRKVSRLWREALIESGLEVDELAGRLKTRGVHRDKVTLRQWLTGEHIIAPRSERDIFVIAELFPIRGKAQKDWQACVDAIQELRALHVSAGSQLSEILVQQCGRVLLEASESELVVDLGLGLVWVLEVEAVEATHRRCPSSLANRLQWLDTDWRDALLAKPLSKLGA